MQGIYHQSLTGNQGQLGPFDPSIILMAIYHFIVDIYKFTKQLPAPLF